MQASVKTAVCWSMLYLRRMDTILTYVAAAHR
jgi:hypothetical protein